MSISNRGDLLIRSNKLKNDELKNKKYYREVVNSVYQPYISEKKRIDSEKIDLFNIFIDDLGIEMLLDVDLSREFYSLCYDLYMNNYDVNLYHEKLNYLFSGFPLIGFTGDFYNYDYSRDDSFINILTMHPNNIGLDSVALETNFTLLENIYETQLKISSNVYIKPQMEAFKGHYIIRKIDGEWQLFFKDFMGVETLNFSNSNSVIFWDFVTTAV